VIKQKNPINVARRSHREWNENQNAISFNRKNRWTWIISRAEKKNFANLANGSPIFLKDSPNPEPFSPVEKAGKPHLYNVFLTNYGTKTALSFPFILNLVKIRFGIPIWRLSITVPSLHNIFPFFSGIKTGLVNYFLSSKFGNTVSLNPLTILWMMLISCFKIKKSVAVMI